MANCLWNLKFLLEVYSGNEIVEIDNFRKTSKKMSHCGIQFKMVFDYRKLFMKTKFAISITLQKKKGAILTLIGLK